MSTLYLIEPGSRLEKEYHRLLVTKDDEVLLRVPLVRVTQVVLVGNTGVTTPALHALLEAEIPLLLVSRSGQLRGRLLPPTAANLPLRQQQYRRNDDPAFSLALAQSIVVGKISNQRTLATRLARRKEVLADADLTPLTTAIAQAQAADSLPLLLGIEGQAARCYFHLYRRAFTADWRFDRRTRRPPKDGVNALLSLGYTFLTQAMMTALEAVGLDPYLGFFHAEKYGRPALALDLLEEFRAPIVDSLTLNLCSHRLLTLDDFQPGPADEGVYLKPAAFRRYVQQFNKKLDSEIIVRDLDRRISYRKLFEVQARRMARFVNGDADAYRAFRAR